MASNEDNEKRWSKDLHEVRGSGIGSRLSLDADKLLLHGWKLKTREDCSSGSVKLHYSYVNPQGKTIKSSQEVKKQLAEEGILEEVLKDPSSAPVTESTSLMETIQPLDELDTDYDPLSKCSKSNNAEQQE